jgi:hypothetical protein
MPKRKLFILFTVVIAIAALFAASEAMAFCTNCDPVPPPFVYDGTTIYDETVILDGGWKIEFLGIEVLSGTEENPACTGTVPIDGAYPAACAFATCYKWHFKTKICNGGSCEDASSGRNSLVMMLPNCCPRPAGDCPGNYVYVDEENSTPGNLAVYNVTQGEPGGYGEDFLGGYAFRATPDSNTGFAILTNTITAAKLPGKLTVKRVGALPFEITGPGCPFEARASVGVFSTGGRCIPVAEVAAGPVYLSAPFASSCTVDGGQVKFFFDSVCTGTPLTKIKSVYVPKVKYCGGLEPGCPQCVKVRRARDYDYTCVQYTAQAIGGNNRFQQCIDQLGDPCDWNKGSELVPAGCAAVFDKKNEQ